MRCYVLPKIPVFNTELSTTEDRVLLENYDRSRITKLRQGLKLDHLNLEERRSIAKVCFCYSDIFYLEGDYLPATNLWSMICE